MEIERVAAPVLGYLQGRQQDMVELLVQLAATESPSTAPQSQQAVFAILHSRLVEQGFRVRRLPGQQTGGVMFARPCDRRRGAPVQLLLGHGDTVWPMGTLARMPVRLEGDRLLGPGVFDMKGGLVQMLFALEALTALGLQPIVTPVVLINSDEEIGSPESTLWVQRVAQVAERVWVLEPSFGASGRLKTARKGVLRFDITITGKAAHAGLAPEEGASAILELAYLVQSLAALNDPARGVSVNVGMVGGGTRPNVVAHESFAKVDVRVPTLQEAQHLVDAVRGLTPTVSGTRLRVDLMRSALPLERTERNCRLWEAAQEAGRQLGLELEEVEVGGASDGNTTSQFAATLDGLGAVGGGAHAAHEFVYVNRLPERAALLALLLLAPSLLVS